MTDTIAQRLSHIRARIDQAVARRGPGPDVTLVGVSKRQPTTAISEAAQAGLLDFGENYAQELRDKVTTLSQDALRWHFIGPIQTNKVKLVLGSTLLHTVDRASLLEAIERRAAVAKLHQSVLIQVNIAREPQKAGAPPEEVESLLDRFADLEHVTCRGLMLIPPQSDDPQTARGYFRELAQLRERLAARTRPHVQLDELSMGMSDDFELAIEEGATFVRVGTAIFGARAGSPA